MSNVITTSLSPNTEADDIQLARSLLADSSRWIDGSAVAELEREFAAWLGVAHAWAFDSGRTSLLLLLRAFGIGAGDGVLLQAYTCVAVPDPVLWAGATPVYVDIDANTLNMSPDDLEKKITPKTRAVIVQHTFGIPADLQRIIAIARKHGLVVIEDCAHAMGARASGNLVGTFGDAAFFSFGRDKVLSSVFGGMAVTNDDALATRMKEIVERTPMPSKTWVRRQLMHPLWFAMVKGVYGRGQLGKALALLGRRARVFSPAVYPQEKKGVQPKDIGARMPNAVAELARHQFAKLQRLNDHRREIAKIYHAGLEGASGIQRPVWNDADEPIFLRYTIQSDHAREIFAHARANGIHLGDWYRTPIAPNGVRESAVKYEHGSCPSAERAAERSLNLPTHIGISLDDARKVLHSLRSLRGGEADEAI
ncbi:MAG: DegT/DnrJ/EryC1/StrS family aminotransferase [Candidatus Kerfeldbacteria bacterium]|nr:DegT/DnrJ/EryC1/StrS family aminotransferase [Candidatus Kerfeldbacteria bacterium]